MPSRVTDLQGGGGGGRGGGGGGEASLRLKTRKCLQTNLVELIQKVSTNQATPRRRELLNQRHLGFKVY